MTSFNLFILIVLFLYIVIFVLMEVYYYGVRKGMRETQKIVDELLITPRKGNKK